MSNILTGYAKSILTDDIDAEVMRYFMKEDEGLVVAARTTEGFITYLIDTATRVLNKEEITADLMSIIEESSSDLAFAVVSTTGDIHVVEIDADGYEKSNTPFNFSDIWEVTYDDTEELYDVFPMGLFEAFGM